MSITIKSKSELAIMREAGRITCGAIWYAGERLKPGMSTLDVDKLVGEYYARHGCKSCFKGLYGFPANACISVNEEVIHGIPKASHRLKEGDIVSIDTGAAYKGFNGDSCWTFPVGKISDEAKALLEVTEKSLYEGIAQAQVGARIGDISHAVEEYWCFTRLRNRKKLLRPRYRQRGSRIAGDTELGTDRSRFKACLRYDDMHRAYDKRKGRRC